MKKYFGAAVSGTSTGYLVRMLSSSVSRLSLLLGVCFIFWPTIASTQLFDFTLIAQQCGSDNCLAGSIVRLPITNQATHYSVNDAGTVAFWARLRNADDVFSHGAILAGSGGTLTTVFESDPSGTGQQAAGAVGINNSGTVAFQTTTGGTTPFVVLSRSGTNPVMTLRSDAQSNAQINVFGEIAFGESFNSGGIELYVTDGTITSLKGFYDLPSLPVINNFGHIAVVENANFIGSEKLVLTTDFPNTRTLLSTAIDQLLNPFIGLNNFDNVAAIRTTFGVGDEIMLIRPDGSSRVVTDTTGDFSRFGLGGVALNDSNVVAYLADFDSGGQAIFVQVAGDGPVRVIGTGDPLLGSTVAGFSHFDSQGLNNSGQVAFVAGLADGRIVLVRADARPGILPDNPILPTDPVPPGDRPVFRLPVAVGHAQPTGRPGRPPRGPVQYLDPVIAVGYEYWVAAEAPFFESLIIPAPLPGGDEEFVVQFSDGITVVNQPLPVGTPFYFTDFLPGGVAEFRVLGIDAAEMLDSRDPTAFVSGLTFVSDTAATFDVFMQALTENGGGGDPSVFDFRGFFEPVTNPPLINVVKAGSAVPVKFSLNGDKGLDIFSTGYPSSQTIACDSSTPTESVSETVTAGESRLTYDESADQYVYIWKTEKSWANRCSQLTIKLVDGTEHVANFKLSK